jgi:predicted GNAT superfamily acetyltransferase
MTEWTIRLLDNCEQMSAVEALQRLVWPGSETDVIPTHMLLATAHNGGLVMGAYTGDRLIGVVYGFPGIYQTPDGPRLKHHSHILGVDPAYAGQGIGFALKRAQWQWVRKQGIDRITWTYDPLLSRNAHLNIARLGAVCNCYLRSEYGKMRDGLNQGLPSDRFQVDWWVNSDRVKHRLSRRSRPALRLDHFLSAGVPIFSAPRDGEGFPHPQNDLIQTTGSLFLVEIPSDFLEIRRSDPALALEWRMFSRQAFEDAFSDGFWVTDFVLHNDRSFYVLADGSATLEGGG